jgi:hypothetical protein
MAWSVNLGEAFPATTPIPFLPIFDRYNNSSTILNLRDDESSPHALAENFNLDANFHPGRSRALGIDINLCTHLGFIIRGKTKLVCMTHSFDMLIFHGNKDAMPRLLPVFAEEGVEVGLLLRPAVT